MGTSTSAYGNPYANSTGISSPYSGSSAKGGSSYGSDYGSMYNPYINRSNYGGMGMYGGSGGKGGSSYGGYGGYSNPYAGGYGTTSPYGGKGGMYQRPVYNPYGGKGGQYPYPTTPITDESGRETQPTDISQSSGSGISIAAPVPTPTYYTPSDLGLTQSGSTLGGGSLYIPTGGTTITDVGPREHVYDPVEVQAYYDSIPALAGLTAQTVPTKSS